MERGCMQLPTVTPRINLALLRCPASRTAALRTWLHGGRQPALQSAAIWLPVRLPALRHPPGPAAPRTLGQCGVGVNQPWPLWAVVSGARDMCPEVAK